MTALHGIVPQRSDSRSCRFSLRTLLLTTACAAGIFAALGSYVQVELNRSYVVSLLARDGVDVRTDELSWIASRVASSFGIGLTGRVQSVEFKDCQVPETTLLNIADLPNAPAIIITNGNVEKDAYEDLRELDTSELTLSGTAFPCIGKTDLSGMHRLRALNIHGFRNVLVMPKRLR